MMTQEGIRTLEMFKGYKLGRFYDKFVGNIQIDMEDYTPQVQENVKKFLKENSEYVMGIISDEDYEIVYVCHINDLQG